MKPPLPYFGGKIRLASRLVDLMPDHGHYVEPFCGSLAVLLAKAPVPHETVNDMDGDLVNFWRVLRDQPAELERVCALTPHSRSEFELSREPTDDPIERARRVWVQLATGRASVRSRTGWRCYESPAGSKTGMATYLRGYVARIAPVADRLANVSLECRPALDVITRYGKHRDVLLYVDPPYLGSTRSSGRYLCEMTGAAEHQELLDALTSLPPGGATVMLSGYPSELYDDALDGWDRVEIPTHTGQGGTWDARTEVVWCNRPMSRQQAWDIA